MAQQLYSTKASRNLIRAEFKMLKHAEPIMVLGSFGDQKVQPLNKTDTIVFRRLKPFNATTSEVPNIDPSTMTTTEGTTPTANTIDYTDVTVTLVQYAVLFQFSSKVELMYEDDIPADMQKLAGEALAECAELVAYGQVAAGTSVLYTNGAARSAVNSPMTLNVLRQCVRSMEANRAKKITAAVKPGPNIDTHPVEPAYVVFISTDMASDVRNIDGFTKRVEYGSAITPVHPREIGAVEEFRFVTSPLFTPVVGAGSGTTNGMVNNGSNVNVYTSVVIAESALGHCSLKGHGYTGISPTLIPASQKNHANPSGMFGYVGADFWYNCVRLNENWMTRIESGATQLLT